MEIDSEVKEHKGITRVMVVDLNNTPLMPCTPPKARHLMKDGKAWGLRDKMGLFYIKLKYVVAKPDNQPIAVGVDPGSKFEGISVVGAKDTVINIMSEAPTHVKKRIETRRNMRRGRRYRKWKRPARFNNRNRDGFLFPSSKARWDAKLNIITRLMKIIPITHVAVEDVKAKPRKGSPRWNTNFSPIEVGKNYFYGSLKKLGLELHLFQGWETKELRELYNLRKISDKSAKRFESHCVDSWVLAAHVVDPEHESYPTKTISYLKRVYFKRRQLHLLVPAKGGKRKKVGGTRHAGFTSGTLVRHSKWGLCTTGGSSFEGKISLHHYKTNKRLTSRSNPSDLLILTLFSHRRNA